jgi:ABC-type bacteriocin/lantibiotic exporter with double-glycine peptidase domain
MFIGRILTVNMMVDYESRTANSVFLRLSKKKKLKYDNSEIIRLLSKDCRFGGRIVQEISNLVMPVCVAFVAFPFLFYINVQATLVVLLVILLTLIPYIYIASRASTVSYSFEQSAGKDSQYKKDAINRIKKQTARVKNVSFPHEDFQKYYKKRLIMPHYGILIGGIQIAFCLVVLGWWAVSLERSSPHLGNIVLYGFVAVFMLNQLKSIAKVYANYHVFLAYFQRAFMVIKGISHESMQDKANAEDSVVEISEIDF